MEEKGKDVRFYLFFDSLDAAVRFPDYIDQEFQIKYLGKPFSYIPCPFQDCQCESYAHHFGNDLSSTFPNFGINAEIKWTHELYKTKEMKEYKPKLVKKYIAGNPKQYAGTCDVVFYGKHKVVIIDYSNNLAPETYFTQKQFDEMIEAGIFEII